MDSNEESTVSLHICTQMDKRVTKCPILKWLVGIKKSKQLDKLLEEMHYLAKLQWLQDHGDSDDEPSSCKPDLTDTMSDLN